MPKIKRAIISVTDKTGLVDFCKVLRTFNVEILSTGGTAKVLRQADIPVVDVSDFTGSPEILDGRLKTLHPKIEGGILGIRGNPTHVQQMQEHQILPIDLVVVNLYPFEQTIAKPGCALHEAIENIDIGGPTMLRAAAKNYQDVSVVVDVSDYESLVTELKATQGSVSVETNYALAVKVFQTTAKYDVAISRYLFDHNPHQSPTTFPPVLNLSFEKIQDLRYGENPHQKAALFKDLNAQKGDVVSAQQLHGKELSYNNYLDLEASYALVCEFKDPACVIIKHTNPCGTAVGQNITEAFAKARAADPVSAFGGIVGLNRPIDQQTALLLSETFFECILAPSFDEEALKILGAKKNIRLMALKDFGQVNKNSFQLKKVSGGLLVQSTDLAMVDLRECQVVTQRKPTEAEYAELDFAWKIVKHVKSNAIVFTKGGQSLGVGAGQMSRVDSVKIAVNKSGLSLKGAVLASDAFFPFRDGLDEAARQGITAVVQPGGSVKDAEVIAAANEYNLAMIFTGMRHFKH